MKFRILFIIFLFELRFVSGQIVASSCTAPDSIKSRYVNDADRLAVRKIYKQHLIYKDQIVIPRTYSDTVLNALIAVYNATALPARDTVYTMYPIHTFPDPVLNSISVHADSTLPWMQQLRIGKFPTGTASIDSIMSTYHLSISKYLHFGNAYSWHGVVFQSDSNYNLLPLAAIFEKIPDVYFSEPDRYVGDGNNIYDSIFPDHVELIYTLGWGDCPSGCMSRRFWKFNVYFDCFVEFMGSYGTPIESTGIKNKHGLFTSVYPNPFTQQLNIIHPYNELITISIYNALGQQILAQKILNSTTINTELFQSGIYFFRLSHNTTIIASGKIIRQ